MSVQDFSDIKGGGSANRDRIRHQVLCREVIRRGLAGIVANEEIIGKNRKGKKMSLRIPAYPEYRFGFDKKGGGVTIGTGNDKRGDVFQAGQGNQSVGGGGGNAPGEEMYEMEVTPAEVDEFLFDDLDLPNFLVKQLRQIPVVSKSGMTGVCKTGPQSRLHRRATLRTRIRREGAEKSANCQTAAGFLDDDLRFRRIAERTTLASNAVLICMMDVSGSMDDSKKFFARVFFWLLYRFVSCKYENAELVFLTHHATAREVDEENFFHSRESGGTVISTCYELALEIIRERYVPTDWNIYAFHISDGDNWEDDSVQMLAAARELLNACNLFGYGQVNPAESSYFGYRPQGSTSGVFTDLADLEEEHPNLGLVYIESEEEIYSKFRVLVTKEKPERRK